MLEFARLEPRLLAAVSPLNSSLRTEEENRSGSLLRIDRAGIRASNYIILYYIYVINRGD